MTRSDLDVARDVIRQEGRALLDLAERLGDGFSAAVDAIAKCEGKVIVSGMGKSGHICRKIAATLASTGTSAFFLHPAEGVHGDLGMVSDRDVLIAVSYSGETGEILQIIPTVRRFGVPIVAITATAESSLGKYAETVIEVGKLDEACSLGLAPTTSTTVTLAIGDALAVALLERRGFSEDDFALFHPAGALGRKLLLKVEDLMHAGDDLPSVPSSAKMREVIVAMTAGRLGIAGVVDENGRLVGCVSDGDLRRGLEKFPELLDKPVAEVMAGAPKTIARERLAAAALNIMERHQITSLFVHETGDPESWVGVIHLHDVLRAGLA